MKLKYLNTVLRYYRALTLTPCYLLATWSRPASTWHDSCVITHAQHLSHQRQGPDTKRKCPRTTLLQYLTPLLIIPAPIITSRTSESYRQLLSVCQVIFPSFYLLPVHSFGLLRSHSAPIMWQWRMQVLNCPVYSTLPANWPSRINNSGPSALQLINGKASTPFH